MKFPYSIFRFLSVFFFFSVFFCAPFSGAQSSNTIELGYDDGLEPNLKLTFLFNGGYRFVTRFTPPVTPAQIVRVRYFLADTAQGTSFELHIMDDNYNAPKHEPADDLIDPVVVSGGHLGWNEYDLQNRNLMVEGDFHVGLFYDLKSKISLGAENREPISKRVYDSDCCSWWVREDVDLYLHALLKIQITGIVNSPGNGGQPVNLSLFGNYPNPFNHSTVIRYHVAQPGHLTLALFDALGREVKRLVDSQHPSGDHQVVWDGTDRNGNALTSGVYWCRLTNQKETIQSKLLMIR